MKFSRKLLATVLITACAFSTMANANTVNVDEDSAIYKITANFINNSMRNVKNDINVALKNSILTASHHAEIDSNLPQGKVEIIDLVKAGEPETTKSKTE